MIYFAFGSNMLTCRLEGRIGRVDTLGIGRLKEYKLQFNKKSKDGSLKADAFYTGNAENEVIGVLFNINPCHKEDLDKFEGLGKGYDVKDVEVQKYNSTEVVKAFTYIARDIDQTGESLPYDWYLKLIIAGAEEHNLPEDYINRIRSVTTKQDSDSKRRDSNLLIIKK